MLYLDFAINKEEILSKKEQKLPNILKKFLIEFKRNFRTSVKI